jgi:hypothetical protein
MRDARPAERLPSAARDHRLAEPADDRTCPDRRSQRQATDLLESSPVETDRHCLAETDLRSTTRGHRDPRRDRRRDWIVPLPVAIAPISVVTDLALGE